jgi:hypothetical protein
MPLTSPPLIEVRDEGVSQGYVSTIDAVGAGVVASVSGNVGTLTISGGGGGALTVTETEVDFGTTPTRDKQFSVTDAGIGAASKILISESGKAATGRVAGDSQWDSIACAALPAAGSMTVYCVASPGPVVGKRKLQYVIG